MRRLNLFAVFVLIAVAPSMAADPLFSEEAALSIQLTGPLSQIRRSKRQEEQAFTLQEGGIAHAALVRTRGNSRLRVCKFPPLRIRFSEEVTGGSFAGQSKLKLVTHCTRSKAGEVYVLKEYAAYKIFELLSPSTYKVRLANISYVDSTKPSADALQSYAFFLESNDSLALRLGPEEERTGISLSQLDMDQASLVFIFQYMIGNTDWAFAPSIGDKLCCHNGRLFKQSDKLTVVPYDFDLSGLVSAAYAKPDPRFRINTVRHRLYRGYCTDRSKLQSSMQVILSKREEIMQTVNEIPGLPDKETQRMLDYLDSFFAVALEDTEALLDEFANRCL